MIAADQASVPKELRRPTENARHDMGALVWPHCIWPTGLLSTQHRWKTNCVLLLQYQVYIFGTRHTPRFWGCPWGITFLFSKIQRWAPQAWSLKIIGVRQQWKACMANWSRTRSNIAWELCTDVVAPCWRNIGVLLLCRAFPCVGYFVALNEPRRRSAISDDYRLSTGWSSSMYDQNQGMRRGKITTTVVWPSRVQSSAEGTLCVPLYAYRSWKVQNSQQKYKIPNGNRLFLRRLRFPPVALGWKVY